jgi:hypothetical protein
VTNQRAQKPRVPPGKTMGEDVHSVAAAALDEISAAADSAALDAVRARYLGRNDGLLTVFTKRIGAIADVEARRAMGQTVNALVERVREAIEERRAVLGGGLSGRAARGPPRPRRRGRLLKPWT